MKKIDFKKLGKIFQRKESLKIKSDNTYRDWNIFLIIFTLAVIFVISLNIYVYIQIQTGKFFKTEQGEENLISNINEKVLEKTLKEYREKKDDFNKYKSDSSKILNI